MPIRSLLNISLVLRYRRGSLTYSNIRTTASDANLFEFANAINSLQTERPVSINKILGFRIAAI